MIEPRESPSTTRLEAKSGLKERTSHRFNLPRSSQIKDMVPSKCWKRSVNLHTNLNFLLLGDRYTLSSMKCYSPHTLNPYSKDKRNHLHLWKLKWKVTQNMRS